MPKQEMEMSLLNQHSSQKQTDSYKHPQVSFPESLFARPRPVPQARVIYMDGQIYPPNIEEPNISSNTKYTALSFLPLVLFHQFRYFFNLFFLLIALSQFVQMLKVGFMFTYVAPLLLVLGFTLFKEAYDDYNRKRRDEQTNNHEYVLLVKGSASVPILSKDLKVGQMIELSSNQRIPADMIIVTTSEEDGSVFIRTDQLDGETDWKLRKAINFTHSYALANGVASIMNLQASINAQPPKLDIYNFEGFFKVQKSLQQDSIKEGLNLENTLWGNCFLASGKATGIVTYAGREMRSVMNTHEARQKTGRTDAELNYLSKVLFLLMLLLAALIVLSAGLGEYWLLDLFRQILLLSSIIPISLRVNLDISKTVFSYRINHDQEIPNTIARNGQIPQELGRVQYILSDKTGTLTQNDMVFKKLSITDVGCYQANQKSLLRKILLKNYQEAVGPMSDVEQRFTEDNLVGKKRRAFKRNKYFIVRDFITCLAVCHNVTPSEEEGVKTYQASSPDQIALVKIAEELNLELVSRSMKQMRLKTPLKQEEVFKILNIFPYTSASKRMGIILQHSQSKRIIFYMKGADSIMKDKISETLRGFVLDECEDLSREGLRILVLAQKYLTEKEYQQWKKEYNVAVASMGNRDAAVAKVVESLEHNMDLLGITGVEDKLQEDIQDCLSQIRSAGISVWMITGDKIQTAVCISISAGLKSPTQEIFIIREQVEQYALKNKLNQFSKKTNTVLVIDGSSLQIALRQVSDFFFTVAADAPAVICCRASPTQKAILAVGLKKHTGKLILGIGDGGNDVGMIQVSDIGVGIVGKQGKQAALASDYSIEKFKYLSKLILWHGRLAYKNTSVMAQFVIHRGLIISIIQFVFGLVFYSVAIPIYNGYLMLGYTTVYTMLPVVCIIFDEDVSLERIKEFPQLYINLQKGRELNLKTFLIWVWKSIYQGAVIMILAFTMFDATFTAIVTITFTSLIIAQILNINTILTKMTKIMLVSQLLTLIVYFLSIIMLKEEIDVCEVDALFIKNVVVVVLISWLPLHLAKMFKSRLDPTESEKIMKN